MVLLCVILGIAMNLWTTSANERPIIGVLAKPMFEEYPDIETKYTEVIEAKYVHFIEGGGGRVFPISYKWSADKLRDVMKKINGVLFTGGATELVIFDDHNVPVELTEYSKGARRILDIAIEMNKRKEYFPVWGTCLGFEQLLILESDNVALLGHCGNCSNYHAFLKYTTEGRENARLFDDFSAYQRKIMETQNLTYNNHVWMVDNRTFYSNPSLIEKYKILAYSNWRNETTEYISAVEHKVFPFYGVQFHPEKWNYEVNPSQKVIKTRDSIMLGHGFSNFLVNECRKNGNAFSSYAEELRNIVEASANYYHPRYGYLYLMTKQ